MATAVIKVGPVAATAGSDKKAPKQMPVPNSDFFQLADLLTADEWAIVERVRTYMETRVQPTINKYWSDDAFPFELLPSFKELNLGGLGLRAMAAPAESRAFSRTPKHEGTYQMQNLIVGKAITGHGAFV